ncbi:MAG: ADP-forming succinate--CoA ligase subunit beta [archaeon]|nr:ADP-forming succinate--CoA ligase subunit beta [archaeon]MDA1130027.1 ADP-forming succinate--CoA ligase subunit beta [archaeon]
MNIHEYQGKAMLREFGVPVLEGVHCTTVEQALAAYDTLNSKVVAVKSQIHAGGRGKGTLYHPQTREEVMQGGVKIAFSRDEVETYSTNILGNVLVTIQTGDEGKVVKNLYVESGCDIDHEYYLALLVDRDNKSVLIMASTEGGVDIEHVAEHTPEKIHKVIIDVNAGLLGFQKRDLGLALGLSGMSLRSFGKSLSAMYEMFVSQDCAMVEINPLVKSKSDEIIALDAKISFDENAEFRHKNWAQLRDLSEEEDVEIRAKETGLSYVKLDGNIGCLVNGAGLAMATMDVIKLYGGEPANFLDVGGGADEEQVKTAFSMIMEDPNVKGILVNIFGGIMRCDIIARGVIAATEALSLEVPLVVRLAGTNVEQGKEILAASNLNIHPANDLAEGAQKIVSLIGGGE